MKGELGAEVIAYGFDDLSLDFDIRVIEEAEEEFEVRRLRVAIELADSPDGMDSRELAALFYSVFEFITELAFHQFELGFEPDPLVGMAQVLDEEVS